MFYSLEEIEIKNVKITDHNSCVAIRFETNLSKYVFAMDLWKKPNGEYSPSGIFHVNSNFNTICAICGGSQNMCHFLDENAKELYEKIKESPSFKLRWLFYANKGNK